MKKILAISGSARRHSSNTKLLTYLPVLSCKVHIERTNLPEQLPLFMDEERYVRIPDAVKSWRQKLSAADGLIVCTPEYIHGMPALLKNALEWVTASGELAGMKVLIMTLTPHSPRGEKAMKTMLWSFQALEANILASLSLYQTEITYSEDGVLDVEVSEMLEEAIKLFV